MSSRLAVGFAAGLALIFVCSAHAGDAVSPARQRELVHLVRQDCGACHGLTLQGGLGAPLTAAALRDKPADSLAATILHGRPGTAMPPFKSMLDEAEAQWIATQLLQGFPREN
jgi:cytochrome c55X